MIYVVTEMAYDYYEFCTVLYASTNKNKAYAKAKELAKDRGFLFTDDMQEHYRFGSNETFHIFIEEFKDE